MKVVSIALSILLLTSCGLFNKTATPEQTDYFHGTIYYQIDLVGANPSTDLSAVRAMYGYVMAVTIFNDGNIRRTYYDSQNDGLESVMLDVESNKLKVDLLNSDEEIIVDAAKVDVTKLSGLRTKSDETTIMGYPLDQYGYVAEEVDLVDRTTKKQVTVNYLFNTELKLDKSLYTNVSSELWNNYVSKTGSVYLKMEKDYFDYKISFTAFDIKPGVFTLKGKEVEPVGID